MTIRCIASNLMIVCPCDYGDVVEFLSCLKAPLHRRTRWGEVFDSVVDKECVDLVVFG